MQSHKMVFDQKKKKSVDMVLMLQKVEKACIMFTESNLQKKIVSDK